MGTSSSQSYNTVKTTGKSTFVGGNWEDKGSQEYYSVTTDNESVFVGGSIGKGASVEDMKAKVFGRK
jgi:hypothetical protein